MREIRLSGSEGGGTEFNRFSLPLSARDFNFFTASPARARAWPGRPWHFGPHVGQKRMFLPAMDPPVAGRHSVVNFFFAA